MSVFDPAERVPGAPTWRCPHCRTLQPECSRCRACGRAAVTCATCHHFRPSFVGDLGVCVNDPARSPLGSDEVRPCWVSSASSLQERGLFDDAALPPHKASVAAALSTVEPPVVGRPLVAPSDASPPTVRAGDERSERQGRLIEAPHVAPSRAIVSEVQRRARHGSD